MIEISLGKMVLLALIALIVLGPEKLPGAARTAGALLRRVRSGWDNVRAEVERELEIEEIKRSAREAVAGAEAAQKQVRETLKQAHDPFVEAAAMVRLTPEPTDEVATDPAAGAPDQAVDPPDPLAQDRAAGADVAREPAHSHEPAAVGDASGQGPAKSRQAAFPLDQPAADEASLNPPAHKDDLHGNA